MTSLWRNALTISLCLLVINCLAQEPDTTQTDDITDYSQFNDASQVKRFATQKILNLSASRLISIGYEFQGSNAVSLSPNPTSAIIPSATMNSASGPRVLANFPLVSNDRVIVNLGGQYWGTNFNLSPKDMATSLQPPLAALDRYMQHSIGIFTTIFKPLDEKHFLIVQAGADYNSIFPEGAGFNSEAITVSASAIYGWKLSDRNMWGLGVSRTYRLGRVIHVPVLLWNKTFNDKWGIELVFPAKGFVRRNLSPKSLLLAGYELEGNQYFMPGGARGGNDIFLQRGEIKPRLQWDQQIKNFIWLSVQGGLRINGRFDFATTYRGADENVRFVGNLGQPFFMSVSLNLVSP